MERRQQMDPAELRACREAFERLDACGYKDLAYDNITRRYTSLFTQGRWVNWQNAWREGQKYLKGERRAPVKVEEPEPVKEAAPRRIMRVARTPQG